MSYQIKKVKGKRRDRDRLMREVLRKTFREKCLTSSQIKDCLRATDDTSGIPLVLMGNVKFKTDRPRVIFGNRMLLWFSVISKCYDLAEFLVQSGADVNEPFGRRDPQFADEKCTVLHVLLNRAPTPENERLLRLVIDHGADLHALGSQGQSMLHVAVCRERVQLTEMLLEKGVDVNVADSRGMTALLMALLRSKVDELLPLLMKHGADVTVESMNGDNALQLLVDAPGEERTDLARALIEKGVSIDHRNREAQYQPIHCAAIRGKNELVKLFLDHGANVNAQAMDGQTPLYVAGCNENTAVLETLLKRGATIDMKIDYGRTALHGACHNLKEKSIGLLLAAGADLLIEDQDGNTPFALSNPAENMENPSVELMLKALALKKVCLQPSIELKDERLIKQHPKLSDYYRDCHAHIFRIKFARFIRSCTFWDLLTESHRRIVALMRNPDFEANFVLYDLSGFSMYAEDVRRAFESAQARYRSMLEQEHVINKAVYNILPDLLVRKVVCYIFND